MVKINDLKFEVHPIGRCAKISFSNGYGVSVIVHESCSWYDISLQRSGWNIKHNEIITDKTFQEWEANEILAQIEALPSPTL